MQILRVADLLTRIGDARVFGKELTQAQFNVLMVLKRHDGAVSQKEILANLVSTKGNVSIHVTNLTRMGYLRKRTAPDDGRRHEITLTAKGRRVLSRLEPLYEQQLRAVSGALGAKQTEAALSALSRLQDHCESALSERRDATEGSVHK